ncbi:hypothetical protein Tco_0022226 [Tanacetum coccineum]
MSVYDTDIEDEEGFVRKGGFGGEEDNIEDIVVMANDICSSMIQTTLNVDVEEDVNTKSHELMGLEKILLSRGYKFRCYEYKGQVRQTRGRVFLKRGRMMQRH